MIPYYDLHAQYKDCQRDVDEAIQYCLTTSQYMTGPIIEEFEANLAVCVQAESAAAVGSGSMALILTLQALGIGPGDEVITTPLTFISTPEAIVQVGAEPVFVDVDDNYLIDVNKIKDAITEKTKAILFVDLYGQCPDIGALRDLVLHHDLHLIEDAAQSIGSFWSEKPVGSLPVTATCFSFNPIKNLGAIGNAGAVVGSKDLIDQIKSLRNHGASEQYVYDRIGYNSRMDCIQAKVLSAKLPHLQGWLRRKREVTDYYTTNLKNVVTPVEVEGNYHSFYAYVIQHDNRDALRMYLLENEVATLVHYPNPCHTQKAYSKYRSNCPNAEYLTKRIVSLPAYFNLHPSDAERIVRLINTFQNNIL